MENKKERRTINMIEHFDYYKDTYNITEDTLALGNGGDIIRSGDTLTHFIGGDPDITEDIVFIGVDRNGSPLFIPAYGKDHEVMMVEDTENLFRKA